MTTVRDYHGGVTATEALKKAVRLCGGPTALAKRMGIRQSVVSMWLARESTPPERCNAIEAATGGAVRREELRPDIFRPTPKAKPTRRKKAA